MGGRARYEVYSQTKPCSPRLGLKISGTRTIKKKVLTVQDRLAVRNQMRHTRWSVWDLAHHSGLEHIAKGFQIRILK